MKKLILFMAMAVVGYSQFAMAQEAPNGQNQMSGQGNRQMATPDQRAKRQTDMMAQDLALSADAKTKVYDINLKYAQKQEAMKNDNKTKEEMMSAWQQMKKDKENELKGVLTPEQFKTYSDKMAKMGPSKMQATPGK